MLQYLLLATTLAGSGPWLEWGGPTRDFHAPEAVLAAKWPAEGPKRLWTRPLGDGYSAILADDARLFTLFRRGDSNVASALDAKTGTTLWEQALEAAPAPGMFLNYGSGPNATPLIVGERMFVVTFTGRLCALDVNTGGVLWKQELWKDMGGTFRDVGYSASPIAYKDTILLPVGGAGQGVVAFRQNDGAVLWKRQDFDNAMSSPLLIQVDGEEQLVLFMVDHVIGVHPGTGDLLWSHEHKTQHQVNAATPVWCADNTLVISSAYGTGARALKLERTGGKTAVRELWASNRFRVHHGNLLRIGDYVYGSSGDFGPAPLTAVHVPTGRIAWQDRHFSKSTMVYAGGKVVLLDEDGKLALTSLTPEGLTVHSEAEVLTKVAWTAPTLVGTRLYVRDRASISAFDLGPSS